jgi:hypothetical protein
MADLDVDLPNDWEPRQYQQPVIDYLERGGRRAVSVWHRRAGKDAAALNWTASAAHQRVGNYWHLFPEQNQARKALWQGVDKQGRRIIDQAFPREIRRRTSENEMLIEFMNGSTWQLVGSDRYDSLVGSNPVGVVFSEYALAKPQAWGFLRSILVENGGWVWFISTPRGRNHLWQEYQSALRDDDSFADTLTVEDTGVLTPEDIQRERDSGMSEALVQQEYYCSFLVDTQAQFISQVDIDDAVARIRQPHGPIVMGVDVARFGDDSTAIALRDGDRLKWVVRWQGLDTMQTAARVGEFIEKYRPSATFVDDVGVGAGVTDRLRQLGYSVIGVNAGARPMREDRYVNRRAEMWGRMRDWMAQGDIPDDRVLVNDLAMVQYDYDARNRIALEKKSEMKKRGLPSPDVGDALALTFAEPVAPPDVRRVRAQVQRIKPVNPFDALYVR